MHPYLPSMRTAALPLLTSPVLLLYRLSRLALHGLGKQLCDVNKEMCRLIHSLADLVFMNASSTSRLFSCWQAEYRSPLAGQSTFRVMAEAV